MIFAPFSLLKSCSSVFVREMIKVTRWGEEQIRSRGQKTPSLPAILILGALFWGDGGSYTSFFLSLTLSLICWVLGVNM